MKPKLRFKGFSGAWDSCKLEDVLKIQSGKDYKHLSKGNIPVYGTGGYMLSVSDYLYDGESVCIGRKGTINKPIFLNGKFWTVDTLFYTNSFVNVIPKFVFYVFQTINWLKYNEATGVPSLSKNTLYSIAVDLPNLAEQQKIADFLSLVDVKIEKLGTKIELLKTYKKGMMQKIFSQKFRFKQDDGSDYPDWEEKKLGEVADCWDNLRAPLNEKERNTLKGNIPYCGANGILDYINKYQIDDNIILLAEDGGHFNEYETKPIAYRMSGKCWVNNHAHILKAKQSYDQDLLFFLLEHKNILSFLSGGTRQKLNKSEMLKIPMNLPKDFSEQQKIATLLSSLDQQIDLLTQQHTLLIQQKKSYLSALL
jgi:type I restriction enzyme S subunit